MRSNNPCAEAKPAGAQIEARATTSSLVTKAPAGNKTKLGKNKVLFRNKILNQLNQTEFINNIRVPKRKLIVRNLKGKRTKRGNKLRLFHKDKSDSYSSNTPKSPFVSFANMEMNKNEPNFRSNLVDQYTMTEQVASQTNKNNVVSLSSTTNTSVNQKQIGLNYLPSFEKIDECIQKDEEEHPSYNTHAKREELK